MKFLHFSELEGQGCLHGFTLRSDSTPGTADIPQILSEAGLPQNYVMGEQNHGAGVAGVGLGEGVLLNAIIANPVGHLG